MGFLDDLKDKAGDFGDKAKEGLGSVREKASELVGDVKDRFDGVDETPAADTAEPGIDDSPQSPLDTIGDVPEPDLSEAAPPTVGEVPDGVLTDLPEAPAVGSPSADVGAGQLGDDQDEFGPA